MSVVVIFASLVGHLGNFWLRHDAMCLIFALRLAVSLYSDVFAVGNAGIRIRFVLVYEPLPTDLPGGCKSASFCLLRYDNRIFAMLSCVVVQ